MKIKPITLEIESEIWESFKELTPRTIKLNDAVCDLIETYIDRVNKKKGGN